jgi:hypothetical protein
MVASRPDAGDPAELAQAVYRGVLVAPGARIPFVPVFTDEDLAARFVERQAQQGKTFYPFTFGNTTSFVDLLKKLLSLGDSNIAFDPEPTSARILPIATVIATINKGK